jgi:glutathione S-transferase
MKLIIGNKKTSSWSLRPWLLMRHLQIPFIETLIKLYDENTTAELAKLSPSGKVPVLIDDTILIWESMAIFEYLNEKYPEKKMWPETKSKRAHARAVCNEMHGGFEDMRELMSHDIQNHFPDFNYSAAQKDVQRIMDIWHECLEQSGGPYLYGTFTIADAMFAPVVNRFITYDVKCNSQTLDYIKTIRAIPAHQEWIQAALVEKF